MSWTYKSELDQVEVDLQKDTSTDGRWTFHRLMYFEPSQYQDWSQQKITSGTSYLTDLLTNPNIPSKGDILTGGNYNISGFYVVDINSIKTMTSDDNLDKFSYAVVDILYQNKKGSSTGDYSSKNNDLKPWERPVEDFTVTYTEQAVPAQYISSYVEGGQDVLTNVRCYPETTAGQLVYDLTMPKYTRKISWSIATRNKDYSLSAAFMNDNEFSFWNKTKVKGQTYNGGKITIKPGEALILPPGLRRMFYEEKDGSLTPYDLWSYEMIIDEENHHLLKWRNAGTQAIHSQTSISGGTTRDREHICCWYTITPVTEEGNISYSYSMQYGFYDAMRAAEQAVNQFNLQITDPFKRAIFHGEFVTDNVPLQGTGGATGPYLSGMIDYMAIWGYKKTDINSEYIFYKMDFKLGESNNDNIAFREKVEEN